ncbi:MULTISPECIES: type II and III secretion system protein family protein [Serratia]|uniref:type II and III secretion system protein family protein n=1 Tax=Serratia TaxID=613 RepID=UPI000BFF7A17|nr:MULTISPECIES: pilus assembly protein N-terminal domain-containing protein [Serratia]AYM94018.1 type II and III secretion system protein family protein [Serratia sp. 3ACOL1]
MSPGESQVIQVKGSVDTVFMSSPEVADYEMIGDRSIVAYARKEGKTDVIAFDENGEQIFKTTLVVNSLLGEVHKNISRIFPSSDIEIKKIGQSYVISGTVASEDEKDKIYQIVGEGIGAAATINQKKVSAIQGADSTSDDSNNSSGWLDEVIYKGVINKLQMPLANQVNVKLTVVEVTKNFSENLGVDWGTITGASSSVTPGAFRFVKFNADTLSSMVHAISNDSVARVLAEPNLSVLSGETAQFLVGGEVPLVTSSQNGTSVQYKDFGIKLNIGAKVRDTGHIRISLNEEVSNIDSTFNSQAGMSFPTFQTRRAQTIVELADGESFLLAGLVNNSEREALSKIPFIGDVPLLGGMFRNAATERSNSELVVVATVNLVKPANKRNIKIPDFQRTSTLSRFFNLSKIDNRLERKRAREFIEQGGFSH